MDLHFNHKSKRLMANPWYRHGAAVLLAALLTGSGTAFTQTASPGIAECAPIIDGAARLACYDRLSEQLTTTNPHSNLPHRRYRSNPRSCPRRSTSHGRSHLRSRQRSRHP
jgi:hypothetical protein